MGGKKRKRVHHDDLRERMSYGTAVRMAYRIESERNLAVAAANWSVDSECRHKQLPGDPKPQGCDCWGYWEVGVNASDELLAAMAALTQQVEAQVAAIQALTEVLAHVDRNVTAVGYQVRGEPRG